MNRIPAQRRRGLAAVLVPLLVVLGALPLMAPTCGTPGEGSKIFARGSLIIPMDVCYQYQTDDVRSSYTPATTSHCTGIHPGNVIKAYGLVYELIRSGIAVYWIIDPAKAAGASPAPALTTPDLRIQYNGGVPVFSYDWLHDRTDGAAPTSSFEIYYLGGPFVVDGSDAARARAVMQQFLGTFQNVNVHVSNVAFKGYAKRTMAGGWSAGGADAPKLALLDIGSSGAGAKNSEYVIQGYLTEAGLDTPGASGTAEGPHGAIYDRLDLPDFINTTTRNWQDTNLYRNKYQILWVPHWAAPSSCSDCAPGTSCTCQKKYPTDQIELALKTIEAWVNAGGDLFAECAGLGSFEGVFSNSYGTTYSPTYVTTRWQADPSQLPDFQTVSPPGVWINRSVGNPYYWGFFDSPFMQLGDYPFIPQSGAIQNYKAKSYQDPTYVNSTVRLISDATDHNYDIFTMRPRPPSGSRGTIVYLAGHSYSGQDGSFVISGTRLVLNTLFNLGAGCTADGIACNTGYFGICAVGHYKCNALTGQPDCIPDVDPTHPPAEICNGLDDNCNGEVDEGLTNPDCFDPPAGWVDPDGRTTTQLYPQRNVGVCRAGVSVCEQKPDGSWGMSACSGQVLPTAETCNGYDDDCNGYVDDQYVSHAPLSGACYTGPAGTENVGECKGGTQICVQGSWGGYVGLDFAPGVCTSQVLPVPENCGSDGGGNGKDDDCNGQIDDTCHCIEGTTIPCFKGPGTPNVGICTWGSQTCTGGGWTECSSVNADLHTPEPCTTPAKPSAPVYNPAYDYNCDHKTTQCAECNDGDSRSCWGADYVPTDVPTAAGRGQCTWGNQSCQNGVWGASVGGSFVAGACGGYGRQSVGSNGSPIEYCDNVDNNCNGPRVPSPDGSVPGSGALVTPSVDENAICPTNYTCLSGVCVPSACGVELPAPEGYTCSGGHLVQASCGATTCGPGQLCQYSSCIDPCPVSSTVIDPETLRSASLVCGTGTSCGGGACIGGGCYEAGCLDPAKPLCRAGACVADPCASVTCPSGTFCREGYCVQACTFVSCYAGERCGIDGFCVPDPCATAACGATQACVNGRCIADACLGKSCARGQYCDASTGTGVCVDDPCTGIECPAGVCVEGQCYPSGNRTGAGTASRSTTTSSKKGGCGCGSGTEAAWPALLGLLLAPLRRRRPRGPGPTSAPSTRSAGRGPGGLALLLLAAAALTVAPGCKKSSSSSKSEFDPSLCVDTCGEQRCVNVLTDPTHCGALNDPYRCTHVCGTGEQCVDGVCGPTTAVAPYIASLTPSTGAKDAANLAVTIAGERFEAGATVHVAANTGPVTLTCPSAAGGDCQWLSANSLSAHFDLTNATTTSAWTVRVVNPDLVISNAMPFGITIPVPSVTGVNPQSVVAGTTNTVKVLGSGFTSGSVCQLSGGNLAAPRLMTGTLADDGNLLCVVDASALTVANYTMKVKSEVGAVSSSYATLTVSPSDPLVYSVSPASASEGTVVNLTITGERFDTSSRVFLGATQVPSTTYFSPTLLYVMGYPVGGTAGTFALTVHNGSVVSNAVAFTVGASPPAITGFSPPIAWQGDPDFVLTFTGTDLPSVATIEVEAPGTTTFVAVTPTTVSGTTQATAHYSLLAAPGVSAPEGTYLVRLRYTSLPGSPASAPWPMRVLSNQAILRDYAASPAPEQAGMVGTSKTGIQFDVSNIRPPTGDVRIGFDSVTATSAIHASVVPTSVTASTVNLGTFSLVGLEAGTYTFTVLNPNGASPSNALTFAVTPGTPTVTSVCLVGGAGCTQVAPQQDAALRIHLTGTNFARKDANGNGSVVMIASAYSTNWAYGDPCNAPTTTSTQFEPAPVSTVTVLSSTDMEIWVDSRAAYADPSYGTTYYVGIWNPGGTAGPLKSSCVPACATITDLNCQYVTAPAVPVLPRKPQTQLPWFKITQ